MKIRSYLILVTMFTISVSYGQIMFSILKIEKLEVSGYHVQFNPEGTKLLFTSNNFQGLKLFDIKEGKVIEISNEKGAGYQPVITATHVIFKKSGNQNQLEKVNFKTGERVLINATLNKHSPMSYATQQIALESNNKTVQVAISADLNSILLINSFKTTTIAPLGKKVDYLNLALSPDQSKLLFRVSGIGSFVTDLEGNVIKELGNVEFPKWLNDETVLFAEVKDDGHQYLSSSLYISNIREQTKSKITSATKYIALFPEYNSNRKRIVFNTPMGDVILIHFSN